MELSFYNNGHKETYKNPLIDEILEVDLCKGAIVYSPVFGELWNIVSTNNEASEKNPYQNELYEYQIDKNAVNIFAA